MEMVHNHIKHFKNPKDWTSWECTDAESKFSYKEPSWMQAVPFFYGHYIVQL